MFSMSSDRNKVFPETLVDFFPLSIKKIWTNNIFFSLLSSFIAKQTNRWTTGDNFVKYDIHIYKTDRADIYIYIHNMYILREDTHKKVFF